MEPVAAARGGLGQGWFGFFWSCQARKPSSAKVQLAGSCPCCPCTLAVVLSQCEPGQPMAKQLKLLLTVSLVAVFLSLHCSWLLRLSNK